MIPPGATPRLPRHVRLRRDDARGTYLLLAPEGVIVLNGTGAAILCLCDGTRAINDVAGELEREYHTVDRQQISEFLERLLARHLIEVQPHG